MFCLSTKLVWGARGLLSPLPPCSTTVKDSNVPIRAAFADQENNQRFGQWSHNDLIELHACD